MFPTPTSITFPRCTVHIDHEAKLVRTVFYDGKECPAAPHYTDDYRRHSLEKGAGGDEWKYCWQHELAHVQYASIYGNGISPVLWDLAHGGNAQGPEFDAEERAVQAFQRFYGTGRL